MKMGSQNGNPNPNEAGPSPSSVSYVEKFEYRKAQHYIVDEDNEVNISALASYAVNTLREGNVIAIPTDTLYGLAASVACPKGIEALYAIKGRDINKPIAICVANLDQVEMYGRIRGQRQMLFELFPSQLTLVFERTRHLNPLINPNNSKIGIRIPETNFARRISAIMQGPIALTSANPSGSPSCLHPDEFNALWPKIGYVFDGGRLGSTPECEEDRIGSTVIDLSEQGYFKIIRKGKGYRKAICTLTKYRLVESVD